MMDKEELLNRLADLLAGMQVPYSLGEGLLGAARQPYLDILRDENTMGWRDADDFRKYLDKKLFRDVNSIPSDQSLGIHFPPGHKS